MSYKALYRTYRPQKFDEVAGQKQIIQTLKNAIKDNKIAHAYLFTGPRGTGKTTMAKLLAKALNCTCTDVKPCNECEACRAINEGSFADVIEIDAASNNGVDEVRSLIDKVKYAPIEGKYKVYIIDEVHMMSQGAFNALLKTLEEPPAHVIFVLATTEPHKVLPTILSRCQRFDFGRISNKDIKERIECVLESENIVYDDEVVSANQVVPGQNVCLVSNKAYAKQINVSEVDVLARYRKGVKVFDLKGKASSGENVICAGVFADGDEVVIVTSEEEYSAISISTISEDLRNGKGKSLSVETKNVNLAVIRRNSAQ